MKTRIEKWEQEHAKAFVVNGQNLTECVAEQWETHRLGGEKAEQEGVSEPHLGRGEMVTSEQPSCRQGPGLAAEGVAHGSSF